LIPAFVADRQAIRDWSVGNPAKRECGEGTNFSDRLGAAFR
jgi:hypothetical protein